MSTEKKLVLYHVPGFRSSRALWMYLELEAVYGDRKQSRTIPQMEIQRLQPDEFRTNKKESFLKLNPNGKVGDVNAVCTRGILRSSRVSFRQIVVILIT